MSACSSPSLDLFGGSGGVFTWRVPSVYASRVATIESYCWVSGRRGQTTVFGGVFFLFLPLDDLLLFLLFCACFVLASL